MLERAPTAAALALLALCACSRGADLENRPLPLSGTSTCPGVALRGVVPGGSEATEQQGQEQQGQQQQGCQQQGTQLMGAQAEAPLNSAYAGWWNRRWLRPARIEGGRILADGGALSGAALVNTWIPADASGKTVWTVVRSASQDSTYADGSTWLYAVEVYDSATGATSPLCGTDAHGVAAAIPIAATFDTAGTRLESSTHFTFACTAGALAKCYRWGYRPWLTDASGTSGRFASLHWACTRMARADYCGNGRSWTRNGTTINVWDTAPAPGPFQTHGPTDPTFFFEAGWSTSGAVCLSKERWATLDPRVAQDCPNRLIAPGASTGNATICQTPDEAAVFDTTTQLFNESQANVYP